MLPERGCDPAPKMGRPVDNRTSGRPDLCRWGAERWLRRSDFGRCSPSLQVRPHKADFAAAPDSTQSHSAALVLTRK
jgi:hypothetical protein